MRHIEENRDSGRGSVNKSIQNGNEKSPFLTSLEVLETIQHVLTQHTNTHSTNIQIITLTS